MFIFNPVNTEVVDINRRLDICVALVKIMFQKNNIGVISVFGISLVFQNTILYLVFQILAVKYLEFWYFKYLNGSILPTSEYKISMGDFKFKS